MSELTTNASNAPQWRSATWWINGLFKSAIAAALVGLPLMWFQSNYRFTFDAIKGFNCVDYSLFLVDIRDKEVRRDAYFAFISNEMEPFYAKGTMAIKIAAAVQGDDVVVDTQGVHINGAYWGPMQHIAENEKLWQMGKRIVDYQRDETVPPGKVWMLGTHERSFDARYWGYIDASQIIGRAIPLF